MMVGTDWGGIARFGLIVGVAVLVFVCGVVGITGLGDVGDDFFTDRGNAHSERMRELDTEQQRQDAREAEADAEAAEAQVEIERARAEQEVAKQRKMEYEVEWQRAAGDKAESDANAYNTKRMADASFAAIQRQGRLLSLSHYQYMFFGGILMVALMVNGALALTIMAKRKEKEKQMPNSVVT